VFERVLGSLKIAILVLAGVAALVWFIRHIYLWRRGRRIAAEEKAKAEGQPPP
jgi:hypothetical protein